MNEKSELHSTPLTGEWFKSSYSAGNGEACVELMPIPHIGVAIRDSKNPTHPELRYRAAEFAAFINAVKSGEIYHPLTD